MRSPVSVSHLEAPLGYRLGECRTDGQPDLLLLVGQAIVVVEVKVPLGLPVGQQLHLQAEEDAEVALAAHHPDGEPRGLQEAAHLEEGEAPWNLPAPGLGLPPSKPGQDRPQTGPQGVLFVSFAGSHSC